MSRNAHLEELFHEKFDDDDVYFSDGENEANDCIEHQKIESLHDFSLINDCVESTSNVSTNGNVHKLNDKKNGCCLMAAASNALQNIENLLTPKSAQTFSRISKCFDIVLNDLKSNQTLTQAQWVSMLMTSWTNCVKHESPFDHEGDEEMFLLQQMMKEMRSVPNCCSHGLKDLVHSTGTQTEISGQIIFERIFIE